VEFDALHGREIHGALDEGRVLGGEGELQERGALCCVLGRQTIGLRAKGASGVEDPQADDIRVLCPAVSLPGEPSAALAEKAAANPPANPAPAASAPSSDDGADALASVDLLCQQSEIQQSTVMLFAKKNKLARDNQNALSELATTKLKNLIKVWPNILPELRQIQGQGEPVA
jgi:hypothetical protein